LIITVSSLWCATWHYMGGTNKIKLSVLTLGPYISNASITSYH